MRSSARGRDCWEDFLESSASCEDPVLTLPLNRSRPGYVWFKMLALAHSQSSRKKQFHGSARRYFGLLLCASICHAILTPSLARRARFVFRQQSAAYFYPIVRAPDSFQYQAQKAQRYTVSKNPVQPSVWDACASSFLLLCHPFPSIAFSWKSHGLVRHGRRTECATCTHPFGQRPATSAMGRVHGGGLLVGHSLGLLLSICIIAASDFFQRGTNAQYRPVHEQM